MKSFVDLTRYLFTLDGVKIFLSQRICQDPIEKFFGCQRQRGATHDNPNVSEFCKSSDTIRVVGSAVRGNCRGKRQSESVDLCKASEPLPKRKKLNRRKTL